MVVMGEDMGLFNAWLLIGYSWGAPQGMVRLVEDRFNVQEKVDLEWVYTVGDGGFLPGDELKLHAAMNEKLFKKAEKMQDARRKTL